MRDGAHTRRHKKSNRKRKRRHIEADIAADVSGEPLLEGGIPGQKRRNDPPQQGKDTPEDCTPWVTHAGPENEVEPGGQGGKVFPYVFV